MVAQNTRIRFCKSTLLAVCMAVFLLPLISSCQTRTPRQIIGSASAPSTPSLPASTQMDSTIVPAGPELLSAPEAHQVRQYGVTNQQLDGNHVVDGYADLTTIKPIDVELAGIPTWVAAVPVEAGVLWGVVLDDGRTVAVLVEDGVVTQVPTQPEILPAAMPPLLEYVDGVAVFVLADGEISTVTNAVPVEDALIGVESDGDLIIESPERTTVLDADALPDARVLVDDTNRILFASNPTSQYAHGALGDTLEAGAITLAAIEPEPRIVRTLPITGSSVLEGIAPIWADFDGDGQREIIVTLSDADAGARVVALEEDGQILAAGPPVGSGNRWRHQIAVAPFGPEQQLELAVVSTPHIGGVIEFYALSDRRLDIVATLPGFTSHILGSRNLDMVLAAIPADGRQAVLLAPSQDRRKIGAIRHGENGAETLWLVEVGSAMITNMAAASLDKDLLGICVGREDGVLRIWQPS